MTLFSFLGASAYQSCVYQWDNRRAPATPFCQAALCQLLPQAPTEVIVFATPTARQKNEMPLRQTWQTLPNAPNLTLITIPEAQQKDDFWEIFRIMDDHLANATALVADITHSFRYLPLLGYAVLDYLQQVRHRPIEGIYYAAFEVPQPNKPFFDLTGFLAINRWSGALSAFRQHGNNEALSTELQKEIRPILRQSRGQDREAAALRQLNQALTTWTEACRLARGATLEQFDAPLHILQPIKQLEQDLIPFLRPELDRLQQDFAHFGPPGTVTLYHAATWCRDHGLLPQAYTLLQEGVLSHLLANLTTNLPQALSSRARRQFLSGLLNIKANNLSLRQWRPPVATHPHEATSLLAQIDPLHAQAFALLTEARNDCNHGGFVEHPRPPKTLFSDFAKAHENLHSLFFPDKPWSTLAPNFPSS